MDHSTSYAVGTPSGVIQQDGTVVDLAPLAQATDPSRFAGMRVQCSAPVTRVLDRQNILVQSNGGRALCVHMRSPDEDVRAGDLIAFDGTVKNLSDTARAVLSMSDRTASAIEDQTIFIDVKEVRIVR